jgi:hypothetical protein
VAIGSSARGIAALGDLLASDDLARDGDPFRFQHDLSNGFARIKFGLAPGAGGTLLASAFGHAPGLAPDAVVNGTTGNDFIHVAGDGHVAPGGYADTPAATDSDDTIDSGQGTDIIYAGGGNDTINANAGANYTIFAGDGNDTITANLNSLSSGQTSVASFAIDAGNGDDTVSLANAFGGPTTVTSLVGGSGTDLLQFGAGIHFGSNFNAAAASRWISPASL